MNALCPSLDLQVLALYCSPGVSLPMPGLDSIGTQFQFVYVIYHCGCPERPLA